MRRSRLAVGLGLVGLAGVASAGVVAPGEIRTVAVPAGRALVTTLEQIPTPLTVVGALGIVVVLWFLAIRYVLVFAYRLWRRVSERVYWALTLVFPESPVVKFASGTMVLIAVVILIVGGLPALVGGEGASPEWDDVVDGDAIRTEPVCDGTVAPVNGRTADRDNDGLPDAWERAGETPQGAALPGADPGRKDLYAQVNYGDGVEHLTDEERSQLRESWASMPVANPDGSTGITLHLDVTSAGAGDMGESARLGAMDELHDYYTADRLGPRQCVYRQITYGTVDLGGIAGVGSSPGFATFVEGSRESRYDGTVSFRVAVTNHELLHTVVGHFDGKRHATDGWLAERLGGESLSAPVAQDINETGIHGPAS